MEKAFELTPIRDVVHPSKLINHELLFSDARQQMPDPDLKRRLERIPLPPFLASLDKLFHDKNITLVTPKAGRPPLSIEDSTIWIAKVDRPSDDSLIIERGKVRNEYRGELNQFLASRWADGPIFKDPPPLDPNSIAGQIVARAELEEKARALMLGPYLTNIEAQLDSNGNPISYDFVDKKENPDG
jgi:hypothetical protein